MAVECRICSGKFHDSPDYTVLCKHKDGLVHLGCCVTHCSYDGKPCENAVAKYKKID